MWPWTTTAWSRRRCGRPSRPSARPAARAKFLYTIPNFHNPAGVTLAVARRAEILRDLRARTGVLVVEDNPYGLLGFDGQTYPALRSYDRDNVVYLGSFSKTFAAGLRVGWVLAPHAVRERLVLAAESATLCPPTINQMIVSRYLSTHDWRGPDQAVPADLPGAPRRHAVARWTSTCRPGAAGPGRTAASTCG